MTVVLHTEDVACSICGTRDAEIVGTGTDREYQTSEDTYTVVACKTCGHRYLSPRPTQDELARIYPSNYHAYNIRPAGVRLQDLPLVTRLRHWIYRQRFKRVLRPFKEKDHIDLLDVGCGDGWMLDLYRACDPDRIRTFGVDFEPKVCEVAASFGHKVYCTRFEEYDKSQRFDIVNLSHVIEHVSDPVGVVKKAFEVLRPGGLLVLETPNSDTVEALWFQRGAWGAYHIPRHWNFYNSKTIRRLGELAGFSCREIVYNPAPVHWVWTFNNLARTQTNVIGRIGQRIFAPLDVFSGGPKAFLFLSLGTALDLIVKLVTRRTSNMMAIFTKV